MHHRVRTKWLWKLLLKGGAWEQGCLRVQGLYLSSAFREGDIRKHRADGSFKGLLKAFKGSIGTMYFYAQGPLP